MMTVFMSSIKMFNFSSLLKLFQILKSLLCQRNSEYKFRNKGTVDSSNLP